MEGLAWERVLPENQRLTPRCGATPISAVASSAVVGAPSALHSVEPGTVELLPPAAVATAYAAADFVPSPRGDCLDG